MGECLLGRIACWIVKSYLMDVNTVGRIGFHRCPRRRSKVRLGDGGAQLPSHQFCTYLKASPETSLF